MDRREELLSQLLALEESEHPNDRLSLHGALNEARRKRDHGRAMSAHPILSLHDPDDIDDLHNFIRHLREPITAADKEFGPGAMEDCLIPLWTACDDPNVIWEEVLCCLRRIVRKIHATTAQDHVGPIEGMSAIPKGDLSISSQSPCWVPVSSSGVVIRPMIKCQCGQSVNLSQYQIFNTTGTVTPVFHHHRAQGGCGWSRHIRLMDYSLGDFLAVESLPNAIVELPT